MAHRCRTAAPHSLQRRAFRWRVLWTRCRHTTGILVKHTQRRPLGFGVLGARRGYRRGLATGTSSGSSPSSSAGTAASACLTITAATTCHSLARGKRCQRVLAVAACCLRFASRRWCWFRLGCGLCSTI